MWQWVWFGFMVIICLLLFTIVVAVERWHKKRLQQHRRRPLVIWYNPNYTLVHRDRTDRNRLRVLQDGEHSVCDNHLVWQRPYAKEVVEAVSEKYDQMVVFTEYKAAEVEELLNYLHLDQCDYGLFQHTNPIEYAVNRLDFKRSEVVVIVPNNYTEGPNFVSVSSWHKRQQDDTELHDLKDRIDAAFEQLSAGR
jgi:hypothetical protein